MGIFSALILSSVASFVIRLLFYAAFGKRYMQTLLKVFDVRYSFFGLVKIILFQYAHRELADKQHTSRPIEKPSANKCDETWPQHKEERRAYCLNLFLEADLTLT